MYIILFSAHYHIFLRPYIWDIIMVQKFFKIIVKRTILKFYFHIGLYYLDDACLAI